MVSTRVYRWTLVLMTVVLMTAALVALAAPALAHAKGATARTLTVCQHGCRYGTIQSAVDHSGRGLTIDVRPGRYVEAWSSPAMRTTGC